MHVFVILVAVVPPLMHRHWLLVTLPSLSCMVSYIVFFAGSQFLHAARRATTRQRGTAYTEDVQLHEGASRAQEEQGSRKSAFTFGIDKEASSCSADVDTSIVVVMVDRLEAALRERGAESVRASLFKSEAPELKSSVPAGAAAFALISYRQERVKPDDGATMDCEALLSIAAKAKEAGIESLWLDCWCYRPTGEYNHADFCKTLGLVTKFAASVVWLPHARRGAPSSYQFRLWCTFEATVVAERSLRVHVAGVGLSRAQRWLACFGPFFPAVPGIKPPAEIRELAYFNTAMLTFTILLPIFSLQVFFFFTGRQLGVMHPTLGHQSALASSGQSVLRAMTRRGGDHHRTRRLLACGLPWLPCYDRRDALVVKKVLDGLKFPPDGILRTGSRTHLTRKPTPVLEAARSDEEYLALGYSAYVAALVADSGGDKVEGRTPREWLHKVMVLEDTDKQLAWLDCRSPKTFRFLSASAGAPPNSLPLQVLRQHDWFFNDGASACLFTPVGDFYVSKPEGPQWIASQLCKVSKVPAWLTVGLMIVFWLACDIAGPQFYVRVIIGAATGAEMGAVLCGCVETYCILAIFAFVMFYLCNLLLPPMMTSLQGYAPHLPDLARRLHPHGYNIPGLVLSTICWTFVSVGDVTVFLYAVDAVEQWPHNGSFPLDLSQVPAERQRLFNLAMGAACIRNIAGHMLVASQAYHMMFRRRGQVKGGYLG